MAIVDARKAPFVFYICCFISKSECLKLDLGPKPRPNFTFFIIIIIVKNI